MAIKQRSRATFEIWPGFVDALASLLIIMLFVVTVFIAAQFFLGDALQGRDRKLAESAKVMDTQAATITDLNKRMAELAAILSLEREKTLRATQSVDALESELRATMAARDRLRSERDALQGELASTGREKLTLEERLAALEARARALQDQKTAAEREAAERDRARADAEKDKGAAERARLDAERAKADADRARAESEKARTEADRARADSERGRAEAAKRAESAELVRAATEADRASLSRRLADLDERIRTLEAQKAAAERKLTATEADRAALEARIARLETQLQALLAERDRLQAAGQDSGKKLADSEKLTEEQTRHVALLNRQMAALRQQLASIQLALQAADDKSREQKVEIEDLGRRLNAALASRVQELERYRSEFFGRLREALADRRDIKVVGDRFVFQSEVLFPSGSDELQNAGKDNLAALARSLKEIAPRIPRELQWVLRVDGHTDRRPIRGKFPSNWELSSARAIAVVKYLVDEGVPARNLVAAGFGEYHPLDAGAGEDALARNRRIELKLTDR